MLMVMHIFFLMVGATCLDCNVVLISMDTVAANYVGVYGSPWNNTPHIDEISKSSRVYLNAFAPSSWTLPSHVAMLTGYQPNILGIEDHSQKLGEEVLTLAERLKRKKFTTAAFTNAGYVTRAYGFAQGFDQFHETSDIHSNQPFDKALQWLNQKKGGDGGRPFFLFLHSYMAHEPYAPHARFIKHIDPQISAANATFTLSQSVDLSSGSTKIEPQKARMLKGIYAASIMQLDEQIGRVWSALKNKNLLNNTILIITSDHGQEWGERGAWGIHCHSVYNELVRVPLIVREPNAVANKISTLVSLSDIPATIMSAVDSKFQNDTHGQELPVMEAQGERLLYSQTFGNKEIVLDVLSARAKRESEERKDFEPSARSSLRSLFINESGQLMLMNKSKKMIIDYHKKSIKLFDLTLDPLETIDVSAKHKEDYDFLLQKALFFNQTTK